MGPHMQYSQFMVSVRRLGDFTDDNHVEQAVVATLSGLGQQLAGNESQNLTTDLPIELQELLIQRVGNGDGNMHAFLLRIAEEEGFGCETDQARVHVEAVLSTLTDWIDSSALAELRAQLPADYAILFEARQPRRLTAESPARESKHGQSMFDWLTPLAA